MPPRGFVCVGVVLQYVIKKSNAIPGGEPRPMRMDGRCAEALANAGRVGENVVHADVVELLWHRNIDIKQLDALPSVFWEKAANAPETANTLKRLLDFGVSVKNLQGFGYFFWKEAGEAYFDDMLCRTLQVLAERGVRPENVHRFDGIWAKVAKDGIAVVADTLKLLEDMFIASSRMHMLSSNSFWKKAGTPTMYATLEMLRTRGVHAYDITGFKGGFWAAAGEQRMEKLLSRLDALRATNDDFRRFGNLNSFWHCTNTTKANGFNATAFDVVDTLHDTYGVSIADISRLQCKFWTNVNTPKKWHNLKEKLSNCRLPVDATKLIADQNQRKLPFGAGCTRCTA